MELKDMATIKIDPNLAKEQKIRMLAEALQNPYEFRVGDVAVKVSFCEDGATLQEMMLQYFKTAAI